jgi:hypothetical protein
MSVEVIPANPVVTDSKAGDGHYSIQINKQLSDGSLFQLAALIEPSQTLYLACQEKGWTAIQSSGFVTKEPLQPGESLQFNLNSSNGVLWYEIFRSSPSGSTIEIGGTMTVPLQTSNDDLECAIVGEDNGSIATFSSGSFAVRMNASGCGNFPGVSLQSVTGETSNLIVTNVQVIPWVIDGFQVTAILAPPVP